MISRFCSSFKTLLGTKTAACGILDRRVYPTAGNGLSPVKRTARVAKAITDMVTQSYGPFHAAAMGMALAAYECRERTSVEQKAYLKAAADVIANARPTTAPKDARLDGRLRAGRALRHRRGRGRL